MDYINVKNVRIVEVKFLPPTNSRGSRIKLIDSYRKENLVFSYDYGIGNVLQQAINLLHEGGFNVVFRAEGENAYFIGIYNWGVDFKSLKELK